ncbi:MAG: filamentous hemagglutinin N-terminal domain-containing protein [Cyanobacteria bacterium P01_F01_bin.56]
MLAASTLDTPALAQITPDSTLGNEATIVTPDALIEGAPAELIEGGAIRGENLFHSFSDFNVETLQRIYFVNPAGIETILTRITGGNASSIDGLLGVDGLADLYLLNPNGVAFGPNAQLDIRGSFFVSTAEGWDLGDGEVFSAVNPEAPPILAVTLTPGLQYGITQQADVGNAGNLAVAPGESLVLLGDTVTSTGTLTAPGGQVQLLGNRVGLLDEGRIDVSAPTGGGTINLGGDFQGQGTLPTSAQTVVGPNAALIADATEDGTGGNIIVWSDGLTRFYGDAFAQGGAIAGNGGFVEVSGLNTLVFEGEVDTAAANGAIGTLLLDPTNIIVADIATAETFSLADVDEFTDADIGGDGDTRISSLAFSLANSNVALQATDSISFEAPIFMVTPSVGLSAIAGESITVNQAITTNAGAVALEAPNLSINAGISTLGGDIALVGDDNIFISSGAVVESGDRLLRTNDAGEITVQTSGILRLTEGGQIRASAVGTGNGAEIRVVADSIELDGINILVGSSGIASDVLPGASGVGGDVIVEANTISITNLAILSTSTFGSGAAGNLSINAERIELEDFPTQGPFFGAGGIGSVVRDSGTGGDVTIEADSLVVANGAIISNSTLGTGNAGKLTINADLIELDGVAPVTSGVLTASGIGSQVGASGSGGDIEITAKRISATDGANISTSTFGAGDAGRLAVTADEIVLDGVGTSGGIVLGASAIGSQVVNSGAGGDVTVAAQTISVTNGASISTSTFGNGQAGSLLVTADQLSLDGIAASGNGTLGVSQIGSQVFSAGTGGTVTVDASRINVTNGAVISNGNFGDGNASDLFIRGEQIQVDGFATIAGTTLGGASSINSQVFGVGMGGNVFVDTDALSITNGGNISTSNAGEGTAGNVALTANQVQVEGFAFSGESAFGPSGIFSEVLAAGRGGDITVNGDAVAVTEGGTITTSNFGNGNSGDISITTNRLDLGGFASIAGTALAPSNISSAVQASGAGGNVAVDADTITISDGGSISTTNIGDGDAGNVTVSAVQIDLDGFASIGPNVFGFSGIGSNVLSAGSGGNVSVDASAISISQGAGISTTNAGSGRAGDVSVSADRIELDGLALVDQALLGASAISSEVTSAGSGGAVVVTADSLSIANNAIISTTTSGSSDAANVAIAVTDEIELNSGFISSASVSSANSGDVLLTTRDLVLRNGSAISASTQAPQGTPGAAAAAAGKVIITEATRVFLDSSLIFTIGFSGDGGDITISADESIFLRNGSQISTTAGVLTAGGNGGRVTIDTPFLGAVLSENSDITANAFSGDGGTVTVTAFDIVGLEFQDQLTPFSDITASSTGGGAPGITEFTSLTDVNVEEGLNELPVDLTDPNSLISQQCALQASDQASEFTVVGRGGLPPDPSQSGSAALFLEDLGTSLPATSQLPEQSRNDHSDELEPLATIREAQGWMQDPNGRVYLIGATPQSQASISSIPVRVSSCIDRQR